jgi:CrcB protein
MTVATTDIALAVAIGGFVGAPSRYVLDRAISGRVESDLSWGTFVINITGSFLLGLLTGLAAAGHLPAVAKALLGTGFCGAYTTFSTFSFETVRMLEEGRIIEAVGNVVVSVAVGLGAAAVGLGLGLAL